MFLLNTEKSKMKFMKIGTKPDTFYTKDSSRILLTDTPNDLFIRINNTSYHLHRFYLVPKCGLLRRLCTDSEESDSVTIELNDIPGGSSAFELCAKFCYGITINLGAHNIVDALYSIVALQSTAILPEWCENLGIIRKCIDSIVEKILTPTSEVSWSHTYTRQGYQKRQNHSVPRDWWTEDVSELDLDLFRSVITVARSSSTLPPQLVGEALHVYTCRWLPYFKSNSHLCFSVKENEAALERHRRVVNTVLNMIPADKGSVSERFLLRLVSIASYLGTSVTTKTELIRKAGLQLDEATLTDLMLPSQSSSHLQSYDIELVAAVLESFLMPWRRYHSSNSQLLHSLRKVAKLVDSYLQAVSQDVQMPLSKFVSLAETVPDIARDSHDRLYKAINMYLKGGLSQALVSRGKESSMEEHSMMQKLYLSPAETASIGKATSIREGGGKTGEGKISFLKDPKKLVRQATGSEHKRHASRDR
ncbi:hypothetical protein Bca52824_030758 [Brassica carinata]|uniref:Uncharacterized protein n=1 Tax=Brassica carinata TaxID=52824 RepID=A0A8X7S9D4_BRACI|nr:hypothetical protein Bca52824_030758 [Brassica carinata]